MIKVTCKVCGKEASVEDIKSKPIKSDYVCECGRTLIVQQPVPDKIKKLRKRNQSFDKELHV